MNKTKKFLVGFLACLSVLCGSLGLAGCDETYTTTETDNLIAELEATIEADKTELDGKITALTEAYQAKDNELLEKIEANEQSLTELKTAYEAKMTELENADEANEKAIADLTEEYTEKVEELETAISQANTTIASNKAELNAAISALTARYEAKIEEIDELIDTLQNTDATQNEKITELVNKITALEEATRITGIAFAENGDLLVTFGDGSTQTVKAPEQHVHSFGEWTAFTADDVPCENRLFFHACTECGAIEWKQGAYSDHDFTTVTTDPTCQAQGFDTKTCEICGKVEVENYTPIADHAWKTEYSHDNSYHWIDCNTCDEFKDKQEHTVLSSGECSVCNELVGATEGVLYDVVDGTAQVVMYEGTATRVRIAETYQGAPVTKIGNEAFKDTTITSIVIPDSVISIGDSAFEYCWNLTSIEIPDSVTTIGDDVFYYCDSLTSITIPDGVTSIGNRAFFGCDSLTSIVIPDSVTSIGDGAFDDCDSLTSIVIGDGVTSIGNQAFGGCSSLTSIVIPDSVTSIGSSAFDDCDSLHFNEYGNAKYLGSKTNDYFALIETKSKNFSSYTIHSDTKIIADYAFRGCGSLTSIEIPDSVTSIGDGAFEDCSGLKSVTIGYNVTSIGDSAFYYCESLTSVTIGGSVTSIGDEAFFGCRRLTSIEIPDGVTSIGNEAFYDCCRLVEVVNKSTHITIEKGSESNGFVGYYALAVYNSGDTFTETKLSNDNGYIVYTDGEEKILVGYTGTETDLTLPSYITKINQEAFYICESLTSIIIPNSVTTIGDFAFNNCHSLTSVTIGRDVTSIGYAALFYCDSLTSIRFNGTMEEWNAISKVENWNGIVPATKVVCTDGEVAL